ncbi:hypothetical protein [Chamaesiphon sp. VAR_48_metabat_135_sub]|uniref:hypothetical protein n=1 Tax=Chamaesiphon sp. VAR_48_metabat_135_sub TaxID=2964699 RepID=UPI00286AC870|nr:hypothetical protein [Chamaesiphon sp. VAR_48_metabat_135_sub]
MIWNIFGYLLKQQDRFTDSIKSGLTPLGVLLEEQLAPIEFKQELTYEEAIGYFKKKEFQNNPKLRKAALIRQKHEKGYELTQVFLDPDNNIIYDADGNLYGRSIIVGKIDDELSELFEDENLIILV